MRSAPERLHSLDAFRAFALLLGVCLHAAMAFIVPSTEWAVGAPQTATVPALFAYYVHCFRMEAFFLLAGFFAHVVIGRRGLSAFLRDRALRIALVFVVVLYPMKVVLSACWVSGGLHTGAIRLPPEVASLPLWQLALGGPAQESWPRINLTHLWFLYYLIVVTALFQAGHRLVSWLLRPEHAARRLAHAAYHRVGCSWFAPVALAVALIPLLRAMKSSNIDTPDAGFAWHWPVLTLYGLFFALGWVLQRHQDLLPSLARRWSIYLPLSLLIGLISAVGTGARIAGGAWALEHASALHLATAAGTSLTMCLAVAGWLGLFVRFFNHPRAWVRYLADSSYWIYLVHLPLVVGLQVWFAHGGWPWWIQWPLINAISFTMLLSSYHFFVRTTWIGAWLNGRRALPLPLPLYASTTPRPIAAD
ncbi:MAG: acyltransferase family protein [Opitutaceae bacterium]|nr:acyltransferase family protein [Opitutaceae bacterium]